MEIEIDTGCPIDEKLARDIGQDVAEALLERHYPLLAVWVNGELLWEDTNNDETKEN